MLDRRVGVLMELVIGPSRGKGTWKGAASMADDRLWVCRFGCGYCYLVLVNGGPCSAYKDVEKQVGPCISEALKGRSNQLMLHMSVATVGCY